MSGLIPKVCFNPGKAISNLKVEPYFRMTHSGGGYDAASLTPINVRTEVQDLMRLKRGDCHEFDRQ